MIIEENQFMVNTGKPVKDQSWLNETGIRLKMKRLDVRNKYI
jgi:hypothetical protein